jgi:hypothetical protein
LREDIFTEYSQANFEAALAARARIVRAERVSSAGRMLYLYDRSAF